MSNSWHRPKLTIKKSKSEWVWDIIGYSFYIGSIIFLVYVWGDLPEKVPGHYNAQGEVDRWGPKGELIILPAIATFLLILLSVFEKFPETHNYPSRMNESNIEQFYLLSRKLLNQLKNICLIIFAVILYESVSIALGWGSGFGIWLLPMIILGTIVPIIIGFLKQRKIK